MKTDQGGVMSEMEVLDLKKEIAKIFKELIYLQTSEKNLITEIIKEESKLVKLSRTITIKPESIKITEKRISGNQATLALLQDNIENNLKCLQSNCNSSYQEKYKTQIEFLYSLPKQMKVSYITVKKLDITEEFLINFNLFESINTFENLKSLSNIGRLNYASLKQCGPILIFRLDLEMTFDQLKETCCEIWTLSSSMHCIYDEAFTNLECCKRTHVIDYFSSYQAFDPTLAQGQFCFYLIDKLKHQRELLQIQQKGKNYLNIFFLLLFKAIDAKSEAKEELSGNANNFDKNQLEDCIELIKQNKVLEGINNYGVQKIEDADKIFIEIAKMADNNIIFIIFSILIILFSLLSIASKKSITKWSNADWENLMLFESFESVSNLDMYDYLNNFIEIVNIKSESYDANDYIISNFILYGPARFRFFRTSSYICLDNNIIVQLNLTYLRDTCFNSDYNSNTWNELGLLSYNFQAPNKTGIVLDRVTALGTLDTAGIIIDVYSQNFAQSIADLYSLGNKRNNLLTPDIQAIELQYTIYDPNKDVFVTNLFLIQRDINSNPMITIADSIPFVTSIYETTLGKLIKVFDLIRIFLLVLILSCIPIGIYQKYKSLSIRSFSSLGKIITTIVFQFKNILLVLSVGFFLAAISNFHNSYVDTQSFYLSNNYFDFYSFAYKQKNARYLDQLSLYCIFLYSLKYLQYFQKLRKILVSLKKATIEYLLILFIMLLIVIGLSFLTNFVYGSYIYEYRNYLSSLTMNLKIFIFIENTYLIEKMMNTKSLLSIFVLIFFIFIFKFFLVYLFFPIFVEYYRIECEKDDNNSLNDETEINEKLTLIKSNSILYKQFIIELGYLVSPFKKDTSKKKGNKINHDIENYNQIRR